MAALHIPSSTTIPLKMDVHRTSRGLVAGALGQRTHSLHAVVLHAKKSSDDSPQDVAELLAHNARMIKHHDFIMTVSYEVALS